MPSNGWGGNNSDAHLVVVRSWSPPARPLRRATTAGESRRQWAGAKRHRARTVAGMAHFLLFGSCLTASPVSSTQMRKLSWSQLLSDILSSGHHQTRGEPRMVDCGTRAEMGMPMDHAMYNIRTTCIFAGPSRHTPSARRADDTFYLGTSSHPPPRACSVRI